MTKTSEQRRNVRIQVPFPAVVEGVDTTGNGFTINTVLDNLSKDGLYMRLLPSVEKGSDLQVVFCLSTSVGSPSSAQRVAVDGKVLRVEERPGGACGVAIHFELARFL